MVIDNSPLFHLFTSYRPSQIEGCQPVSHHRSPLIAEWEITGVLLKAGWMTQQCMHPVVDRLLHEGGGPFQACLGGVGDLALFR